jgi:malonate transporter
MSATLSIIAPVFTLVLVGWIARRIGVLGADATRELNRFVVYLSLPALLFDIVAHARWQEVWQPAFIAVFSLSMAAVFILTVGLRLKRRPLADAALDGLSAAYGNTAFMGFPILAAALGPSGLAAAMIATLLTACVLFAVAIVLIEIGLQEEVRPHRLALTVGAQLLRNPLVIAPLVGVAVAAAGLAIPGPVDKAVKMLAGAASPCALVTIGLFLGAKRAPGGQRGDATASVILVGLKLVLQPVLAFGLAAWLRLPPTLTHAVVLLAAMPTGAGPFMLAEFYGREAGVTSRTILISTIASAVTLSVCIAFAR